MKIEYRAFNTIKNKYEKSGSVLLGSEGEPFSLIPHGGGKYSVQLRQECKIEQFTGLTDKNGTKIFEGDITDLNTVIFWHEKKALFTEFYWSPFSEEYIVSGYPITIDRIVIVGNIHENPELLK